MPGRTRRRPAAPVLRYADVLTASPPAITRANVLATLQEFWGFGTLRPNQEQAIRANLRGRDSLLVMPTGGGKSLCYQLPAILTGRLTVVVSPLVALIKDQVDGLRLNGVAAAGLYTGLDPEESSSILTDLAADRIRLLFMAPERLLTPGMLSRLARAHDGEGPRAFAIDEAHCISQWGQDFRPEYRRLAELREVYPRALFHAFTATATPLVREDIVGQLRLRDAEVIIGTFDRPNLTYRVVPKLDVNAQIEEAARRHSHGGVIVYCISRKNTEEIAESLRKRRIDARAYHAGLSAEERRDVQERFAREDLNVVVATVAFGMGIDRSNVRCVIHAAMPKSIEHYQQETGRAGRDGLSAECLLLYSAGDAQKWISILERGGAESGAPREYIAHQKQLVEEVRRFATIGRCRHAFLSEYFGQPYAPPTPLTPPTSPTSPTPDQANPDGAAGGSGDGGGPPALPGCGACDVCLGELDVVPDSTTIARKILSCVARVEQASGTSFGAGHHADVLLGRNIAAVVDRGHDRLSVFGLLRGTSRAQAVSFINQLLDLGYVRRAEGEFPTLTLTPTSLPVLRGEVPVTLITPRAPAASDDATDLAPDEDALFEVLRALRKQLAAERHVPAYQVFSDAVLREFSRIRPTLATSIRAVSGVGDRKASEFGPQFMQAITSFCRERGLEPDRRGEQAARRSPKPIERRVRATTSPSREAYFELFRAGRTIGEIALDRNVREQTVVEHLADFIELTRPADISRWIDDTSRAAIADAAAKVGTQRLKPIMEFLGDRHTYEEIRIVIAHIRAAGVQDRA